MCARQERSGDWRFYSTEEEKVPEVGADLQIPSRLVPMMPMGVELHYAERPQIADNDRA